MRLRHEADGMAMLYAALLLPVFLLLLALVVEIGALRVTRARLIAVADLAAAAAVHEQDLAALARDGRYHLAPSAARVAREQLARGLEPLTARLAGGATAGAIAGAADVAVLEAGEVDALTRRAFDAPTVRITFQAPVRTPLLALARLRDSAELSILSAASAR